MKLEAGEANCVRMQVTMRNVEGMSQERPGFLRVDTVPQGALDGAKGVCHINAVDTVTQINDSQP